MKTFPLVVAALVVGMVSMACGCSTDVDTVSPSSSGSSSSSSGDCHMGAGGSGATAAELGSCPGVVAGASCCEAKFEAYCFHSEVVGNQEEAEIFRCGIGGWQAEIVDNMCEAFTSAEWTAQNGKACANIGQLCVHGGDTDGPQEPLVVAICGGNGQWTVK